MVSDVQITDADREVAASYAVLSEMREMIRAGRVDHHAEAAAKHRHAAMIEGARLMQEAALRALKTVQYSPAPYTDGKARIEALDPAKVTAPKPTP